MNDAHDLKHRLTSLALTVVFVVAMEALLGLSGYFFAGAMGVLAALGAASLVLLLGVRSAARLELWLSRARYVPRDTAPGLYRVLDVLAYHAGISVPHLAWVPSPVVQAFTVGPPHDATIAVTDGLLRVLTDRELVAVLAHEMAHLRNGDLFLLAFADLLSRFTRFVALVGWLTLLVGLPAAMVLGYPVPWPASVALLVTPYLSSLLQLALSRTREYDADYRAAKITGDPEALASALTKIEGLRELTWWRTFSPLGLTPIPSIFRTHPNTRQRLARLQKMKQRPSVSQMHVGKRLPAKLTPSSKARARRGWAMVLGRAHGQHR